MFHIFLACFGVPFGARGKSDFFLAGFHLCPMTPPGHARGGYFPGFLDSWIPWSLDPNVNEFLDPWSLDFWIPGLWISEALEPWTTDFKLQMQQKPHLKLIVLRLAWFSHNVKVRMIIKMSKTNVVFF